jgi:hypothetical protein
MAKTKKDCQAFIKTINNFFKKIHKIEKQKNTIHKKLSQIK